MDNYTKQELELLGIYELRTIARNVGVKSPTTKRHEELVNNILRIQNGEDKAISTKKGRPPKKVSLASASNIDFDKLEGVAPSFNYVPDKNDGFSLCSSQYADYMYRELYPCQGVLRIVEGKKYVYNHMGITKFVMVEDDIFNKYNIKFGDYIKGKAYDICNKIGKLDSVEDVNFSKVSTYSGVDDKKFVIKELRDIYSIYKDIKNDEKPIKVAVELEVNDYGVITLRDDCIYFYSKELDDVKRSYNALVDCLELIKDLNESNKPFTLYLIDIDYIYNVLNVHLSSLNYETNRVNVDAGQFLKTLFSNVKNSTSGNVVIFENQKYRRNDYLDAILNKYL